MGKFRNILLLGSVAVLIAGCTNAERLSRLGSEPQLSDISSARSEKPVNLPMPQPDGEKKGAGSLWHPGAHAFFRDPRASKVGDIITVDIEIADTADLSNDTSRSRTNTEDNGMTNLFGLASLLPSSMTASSLVNTNSDTSNEGTGSISRSETIDLTLAALVTQVLPNGNLVIGGHQQVKVNGELREVKISGIVRSEDITSDNTVDLTQIAEARVSYGGRGVISDVQQPRWGSELMDAILPW